VAKADDPFGLVAFATDFLSARRIVHYSEVRTEELADCFRQFFGVPVFARLPDLNLLCERIGITVDALPVISDELEAINAWHEDGEPVILMGANLSLRRTETTYGHEIREIIEMSFRRANPKYVALDTDNNKLMNPESDQFASCLLMPAAESRQRMAEIGYDLVRFAGETGRSLESIVLRSQALFSERSGVGPVAGIWLYEVPWRTGPQRLVQLDELAVAYLAHLNGFSTAKGKGQSARLARIAFPKKDARAGANPLAQRALVEGRVQMQLLEGFDIFRARDFFMVAEPLFFRNRPPRVLMTAVRKDTLEQVGPWLERLGVANALAYAESQVR
jgi:Zn-dependent peptidase ImmA (M78 family)